VSGRLVGLLTGESVHHSRLTKSVRLAEAGLALLCASYFALVVAMPRLSPFQFLTCSYIPPTPSFPQGGTTCSSSLNPAYPLVFLISVVGTVTLLFGVFGRGLVFSPVFVIGIIALEYGLAGVVSASLDTESGVSTNPAIFSPFVFIGALALCLQTYRVLRPGKV